MNERLRICVICLAEIAPYNTSVKLPNLDFNVCMSCDMVCGEPHGYIACIERMVHSRDKKGTGLMLPKKKEGMFVI